jgi:hypothetical protein
MGYVRDLKSRDRYVLVVRAKRQGTYLFFVRVNILAKYYVIRWQLHCPLSVITLIKPKSYQPPLVYRPRSEHSILCIQVSSVSVTPLWSVPVRRGTEVVDPKNHFVHSFHTVQCPFSVWYAERKAEIQGERGASYIKFAVFTIDSCACPSPVFLRILWVWNLVSHSERWTWI